MPGFGPFITNLRRTEPRIWVHLGPLPGFGSFFTHLEDPEPVWEVRAWILACLGVLGPGFGPHLTYLGGAGPGFRPISACLVGLGPGFGPFFGSNAWIWAILAYFWGLMTLDI